MKKHWWILTLMGAVLFLCAGMGHAQQYRAYWCDAFHDGFKNTAQVDKLVSDVLASNCNMVVVQVRRRGDTYYPSPFEGYAVEDTTYTPGFDSLNYLIQKCHSASPRIEVHAWLCTLPIWNGATPPDSTTRAEHPYNLYPQFLTRTSSGTTYDGSNFVFDPGNPDCLKYEADVYLDVTNRYDLDGVHYDYIRYASNAYGYNQASQDRFNARWGYYPTSDTDSTWLQWRRDQISALARQVYGRVLAASSTRKAWGFRPNIKVSGATITWGNGPGTNDAGWTSTSAYSSVLQDWRAWMEEGILDINMPMTYYRDYQYPNYYDNWVEFQKNNKYNRHLSIGPGVYLNSIPDTYQQIKRGLQLSTRGNSTDGFVFYSYAVPESSTPVDAARFRQMLTTPSADNESNPPYPTKVATPAFPWKESPTAGHIMGVVTQLSGANSIPFDCAKVTIVETGKSMETDGDGYYLFVDLPAASAGTSYTVRAEKRDGTLIQTKQVTVTRGDVTTVNFNLGATDATAPAISGVAARNITDSKLNVTWNTDEPADSQVEYGLTASYGSMTPLDSMLSGSRVGYQGAALGHCVPICNLLPGTTYHYRVISQDSSGNASVSPDYTFTTTGGDTTGPAILNEAVTNITGTNATITWNTHEPATSMVDYGASQEYGSASPQDANLVMAHSVTLSGLAVNTPYHFRIVSADAAGNVSYSYDMIFTTSGIDANPPVITGVSATQVRSNDATIIWTTDEASDSQVEYGPVAGPPYANQSALSTDMGTSHSVQLMGLSPSATYHFRVRSADGSGNIGYSLDGSFTTPLPDNDPPVFSGIGSASDAYLDAASVQLSWNAATDATGPVTYLIYMATTPEGEDFNAPMATTTQTSYTVQGLVPGQIYYFVVRARDASAPANAETNSVELSATPANLLVESRSGGKNYSAYKEDSGVWGNSTAWSSVTGHTADLGSRYASPLYAAGGTINQVTFTPRPAVDGLYQAYVTWGYYGPNCRNARYALGYDGGGTRISHLDQIGDGTSQNYNQWLPITSAPIPVRASSGAVLVANDSENTGTAHTGNAGRFYADAIRLEYIGPAADAPASINATASGSTVTLNWSVVAGSGYKVYRSTTSGSFGEPLATTATNHYTDSTGTSGVTYYYIVRAVDESGYVGYASAQASATPDSAAPVISNVQAANVHVISAAITWNTNENSDSYVEYGTSAGPPYTSQSAIYTTPVTSHSVDLTGLKGGTTYHYRVRSCDAAGNVAYSTDATFTTVTPTPPSFLIESRSGGKNYAWYTDSGLSNRSGVKSTATGTTSGIGCRQQTTSSKSGSATFKPQLSTSAFPAEGYYKLYTTWGTSTTNGTTRCYNTRAVITSDATWGDPASTAYYYNEDPSTANTWQALNTAPLPFRGSADSVVIDDKVNTTNSSSSYFRSDSVKFEYFAPLAPTGVSVTGTASHEVTLSWTNPSFDFGYVQIYRSTTPGALGALVATGITETSWRDLGLSASTTYYYTVRAVSAGQTLNESPNTNQIAATTSVSSPVVSSPSGLILSGWNLVSLPAVPDNPDPLVVLSNIDVPNANLQYWRNNVDGGGYQDYGAFFGWTGPMAVGTPYWFTEPSGPKSLSYEGTEITSNFTMQFSGHTTAPYWVMLGHPFNHNTYCNDVRFSTPSHPGPLTWAQAYDAGIVESSAQCFKGVSYISVGPSNYMVEYDRFEPWRGYWLLLRTIEPITITFPASPVAP